MNRRSFVATALGAVTGLFFAKKSKAVVPPLNKTSAAGRRIVRGMLGDPTSKAAIEAHHQHEYKYLGAQTGRMSAMHPNLTQSDFIALYPRVVQVIMTTDFNGRLRPFRTVVPARNENSTIAFREQHLVRAYLVWTKISPREGDGYQILKNRYANKDGTCTQGDVSWAQLQAAIGNVMYYHSVMYQDPFLT